MFVTIFMRLLLIRVYLELGRVILMDG